MFIHCFGYEERPVLCRRDGKVVAMGTISPGSGDQPIWLDDVVCNGTESSLDECAHAGWGSEDCTHEEDVAVTCQPDPLPGDA